MKRNAALTAMILLAPGIARAEWDADVGLELGMTASSIGGADLTALSWKLGAFIPVTDSFALQAVVPFAFTDLSAGAGGDSAFRFGNPMLAAYYLVETGALNLRVGLGAAIPAATIDDGLDGLAFFGAAGANGFWDSYLFAPETMSILIPARAEVGLGLVTVAAEAALIVFVPVRDNNGDAEFGNQLAAEAMVSLGLVDAGLRLKGVLVSGGGFGGDEFQAALEPFLQLNLGPVDVYTRFTFNLDEPLGPSTDEGRLWGLHGGARFTF